MMNKVQKSSLEDCRLIINVGLCHCEVRGKICLSHYAQSQEKKAHYKDIVEIILNRSSIKQKHSPPKIIRHRVEEGAFSNSISFHPPLLL